MAAFALFSTICHPVCHDGVTYLVDGLDELRPADPMRVVDVEREEVLPQQLAAICPGEAATEGLHGTGQLLVRVSVKVEHLVDKFQFRKNRVAQPMMPALS